MSWRRWFLSALACVAAVGAARHPLHTTITEISYQPSTRSAAIMVRAFEDDVAAAAASREDAGVLAYVARQVALTDRRGRTTTIRWDSIRRQDALLWIGGRAELVSGLSGMTVVNRMMTEQYADQVNVVQTTDGSRRQTVLFTRGDGPKSLR